MITPQYTGVQQSTSNMNASCGLVTAAMSCAISPDASFAEQYQGLVEHMKGLCGPANEIALRQESQRILQQAPPWDNRYNLAASQQAVQSCTKYKNSIPIIQAQPRYIDPSYANQLATYVLHSNNPTQAMREVQSRNISAYDVFSAVKDVTLISAFYTSNELRSFMTPAQLLQLRQQHYGANVKSEQANLLISGLLQTPDNQRDFNKLNSGLAQKGTNPFQVVACLSDSNIINYIFNNRDSTLLTQCFTPDQINQLRIIHFGPAPQPAPVQAPQSVNRNEITPEIANQIIKNFIDYPNNGNNIMRDLSNSGVKLIEVCKKVTDPGVLITMTQAAMNTESSLHKALKAEGTLNDILTARFTSPQSPTTTYNYPRFHQAPPRGEAENKTGPHPFQPRGGKK